MPTTIFYGAGGNAEHGLEKWLGWGLKPVCFADVDAAKHHTLFLGKYQILPLLEAVQSYPDYTLYMTAAPENVQNVYLYLLGVGVPRERIKVLEQMEPRDEHYLYTGMEHIYQALSDSLSRKLFWGRHEYCLSHVLTGVYRAMIDDENMEIAAKKIARRYNVSVLLKAGHIEKDFITDLFYNNENGKILTLGSKKIATKNTHGTGCTMSSALASMLACGHDLDNAVALSHKYIKEAIIAGANYEIGHGHGPVKHFYNIWKEE